MVQTLQDVSRMLSLGRLLVECGMATKIVRFFFFYWFKKDRGGEYLNTKLGN